MAELYLELDAVQMKLPARVFYRLEHARVAMGVASHADAIESILNKYELTDEGQASLRRVVDWQERQT